jgi:nitrite reductase (NADH) large subunit
MPGTAPRRLVVVGSGMAGMRAVEEVRALAPDGLDITVFGAEPRGGYNRILLSPVLAGEMAFAEIVTHDRAWYAANDVELIAGERVVAIDRAARRVRGAHGTERGYDMLLLATGSLPFILPVPGADLPGVAAFRDIADVERMRAAAAQGVRAVVIGGGLLGLEAASGLARAGARVTVVHLMPTLMERQLDAEAATLLQADLRARGIAALTGASTAAILGEDHARAVALADGREIPADLVVMAAGIRPDAALARAAGLACGRGVRVDDTLRTDDPRVFAVGECAEHEGQVFGLVAPLYDMAAVAADHIAGRGERRFRPAVTGTRLKVTGIDMFSAGDFLGDEASETVTVRDAARGVYRRLVLRDDRLIGVVLYGDARDAPWYFDLMQQGVATAALRDTLAFGPVAA